MGKKVILAWWVWDCDGYDVEIKSMDRSLEGAAACYDAKSWFLCLVVIETTLPPTEIGGLGLAGFSSQNYPLKSKFQCFICSSNQGAQTALLLYPHMCLFHVTLHYTHNIYILIYLTDTLISQLYFRVCTRGTTESSFTFSKNAHPPLN